ncbi:MAG: N-acetyl-gamma-glutamyl-phosphate reductase [Candidatus Wallbacteria bacterium]|nr:N-acetyl-gamma-glutamyl-phosphate reductase [Candidatus Wallbacteria bacterium]
MAAKRRASTKKKRVCILGAAGYGGSELLRLLLFHPAVEVAHITSRQHRGQPVWRVHPNLRNVSELAFEDLSIAEACEDTDLVFCALPQLSGMKAIRKLPTKTPVIDLSGDFRLRDPDVYRKYHGKSHAAPELLEEFAYGLPEFERDAVADARIIGVPGGFATAALLGLLPLARDGHLTGPIVLNGVVGSSEFGAEARLATHHPERDEAFRAYRMTDHPQIPEILQQLAAHGTTASEVTFVPYVAPMVRGLFMAVYARPLRRVTRDLARRAFEMAYVDKPFIRLLDGSPDCNVVCGSNFADISVDAQGSTIVVMVAIDNLVKGAAGQAVQAMNLRLGLDERTGLEFPGMRP